MNRYAQIKSGVVENVIIYDGDSEFPYEGELLPLDEKTPVSPNDVAVKRAKGKYDFAKPVDGYAPFVIEGTVIENESP